MIKIPHDKLKWNKDQAHITTPEEIAYIDIINSSGLDRIDPDYIPRDDTLIGEGNEILNPKEIYQVSLCLETSGLFMRVRLNPLEGNRFFNTYSPSLHTKENIGGINENNIPMMGTNHLREKAPNLEAVKEDFDKTCLSKFKFATSKYKCFADLIEDNENGGPVIKTYDNYGNILSDQEIAERREERRTLLKTAINQNREFWSPKKLAAWEFKRLLKRRLAMEEDFLNVKNDLIKESKELDVAFDDAVGELDINLDFISLQELPKKTTLHYTLDAILLELSEPIEFTRLEISLSSSMEIVTACNSSETRIIIIPANDEDQFPLNTRLTLNIEYKLYLDDARPELYYDKAPGGKEKANIELYYNL